MLKFCKKCGTHKPPTDFSRDPARPDKLTIYCRVCNATYQKARREETKRKVALFDRTLAIIAARKNG